VDHGCSGDGTFLFRLFLSLKSGDHGVPTLLGVAFKNFEISLLKVAAYARKHHGDLCPMGRACCWSFISKA